MSSLERFFKRFFDFTLAFVGLVLSWPLIFISWIISSFETSSNGLYFQQRIGKDGKLFNIVKIRTMKVVVGVEMTVTSSDDVRITTIGGFFRRVKIDELPQLWNVLIGQMSFVGPRPDVAGYADKLKGEDRIILSVKPGITGPAQLAYRDEEKILSNQNNHIKYNDEVIWPDKIKINRMYVENYSFFKDLYYIGKTVVGGDVKY